MSIILEKIYNYFILFWIRLMNILSSLGEMFIPTLKSIGVSTLGTFMRDAE